MTKQAGFSMIELIIYITIVGILSIMVGPRLLDFIGRAKDRKAESALLQFKMGIEQYYAEMGHYPQVLEDLIRKPANEPNWRRPFLSPESVSKNEAGKIVDPWGEAYVYRPTKGGKRPFDLYSNADPGASEPYKIDVWALKA